jgi:hypothetical protein
VQAAKQLAIAALLLLPATAFAEDPVPTSPPVPAPATEVERAVERLSAQMSATEKRLAAEEARTAALERALADERSARVRAEEAARAATENARAQTGPFRLGGLAVSLSGFVQADGVLYNQASADQLNPSTGDLLNESRFLLRRGRVRVEADYGIASGLLELDGNTIRGATARVTAGEVSVKWPARDRTAPPYVMATIGLFKIPFGFEVIEKDSVRLFLERSNIIRALFPGEYDLGIRVSGGWRFLRYAVAAMNGAPSGEKQFAARDPNQSKDFVGRVGVDTAVGRRVGITGGLSALYGTGFHEGSPATKDTLIWHDLNLDGQVDPIELEAVKGQPAQPSENFGRYAFGGDLRVTVQVPRLGELAVYGELVWASNLDRALNVADPVATGRDLRELGWYLGFTQELTRYAMIGLRYDRYDPDADARDRNGAQLVPRDLSYSTLAVAVAGGYPPYVRFTLEYDHNTNALGRSASGAPTTLGAEVLTLRGQLAF